MLFRSHAKAVIVDAGGPKAKALLTSANFSETAQRHNYEAGCLITAPWQVDRVAEHFRSLVSQGYFVETSNGPVQGSPSMRKG